MSQMRTKCYKDGERLIFAIEGWDEAIKTQLFELLKPEIVGDLDAQPTKFAEFIKDEDLDLLDKSQPNSDMDKVFARIADQKQRNVQLQTVTRASEVGQILNRYIGRRFSGQNAEQLSSKFADNHCMTFVNTFDIALGKVWEASGLSKSTFNSIPLEDKRKFVQQGIEFFIHIGQKLGYN